MTDKQIVIEDCPYFIGGCCQEYLDGVCENHKCDLKIIRELEQKLKTKEQECEKLDNEAQNLFTEKTNLSIELGQLKAELTRANCQIADDEILQCDMREAIEELKSENKHLNDLLNQALKDYDKAMQTLTEIKEIAEKLKNFYEELGKCEDLTVVRLKQILKKISECEGNDD